MTGRRITERRKRFGHLLGIDRLRVLAVYPDSSLCTESWDEQTLSQAKGTASALLAPTDLGDTPAGFEIRLGQWTAVGSTDCEWRDLQMVATGRAHDGEVVWTERSEPISRPLSVGSGEQLTLA